MPVTVQAQPSTAVSDLQKGGDVQKTDQTMTQSRTDLNRTELNPAELNRAPRPAIVDTDKVCWIEVRRYPYKPDHQVELLHLQAEADALIIKLQTIGQQQTNEKAVLAH